MTNNIRQFFLSLPGARPRSLAHVTRGVGDGTFVGDFFPSCLIVFDFVNMVWRQEGHICVLECGKSCLDETTKIPVPGDGADLIQKTLYL